MTYALILAKGRPGKREETLAFLNDLKKDQDLKKDYGVVIEKVFISFGWPDFILLVCSENVELIKASIVAIRDRVSKNGDNLETATIICTTEDEIREKINRAVRVCGMSSH
ncbi:MAG: hypothetical protein QW304_01865 [Thermoproteota archaeon]